MNPSILLVKVGGRLATHHQTICTLFTELAEPPLRSRTVMVHGGGSALTTTSEALGIESIFVEGVRQTSVEQMRIADMVLSGEVNTALVRVAREARVPAIGLTGADGTLITGQPLSPTSRTAHVTHVDPTVVHDLLGAGYQPIIASVASDDQGNGVNINADELAEAIAVALSSAATVTLLYLSDTPGVLGPDRATITTIDTTEIEPLIASGTVSGGMSAKLRACKGALLRGVHRIVVGTYSTYGDLHRLLTGASGSTITAKEHSL